MPLKQLVRKVVEKGPFASRRDAPVKERQAGAIPYTLIDDQIVFLLITSRRTGRWIFPKGSLAGADTEWEQAAKEAYEEAGVRGRVERQSVGSFLAWKTRGLRRFAIEVEMYPLKVEIQLEKWPEMKARHRHWATLQETKRLLDDKSLVALVEGVAAWVAVSSREKLSA